METTIPKLADDQRVKDVADRLADLNRQHVEAEFDLRELRSSASERVSFAQRAQEIADGVERIEPDEPIETRIANSVERLSLLAAAISAQNRRLSDVREAVGDERIQELLPEYGKFIGAVASRAWEMSQALAEHNAFCEAVAAAGLPVSSVLPAGGFWKRPQILRYFGQTIDEPNSIAKGFFDVLAECGYWPPKSSRKEASHAVA